MCQNVRELRYHMSTEQIYNIVDAQAVKNKQGRTFRWRQGTFRGRQADE